ncbi:MAG: rhamnulokinase [Solirubrobacteraceae bacterium]
MVSVDLGAQSGRVALGRYDGDTLSVTELHRFPNVAVRAAGTLHWDALRLHDGVLEGLRLAARESGGRVDSVAVDTWGIDFALLDRAGRLVGNPVHYRDERTRDAMEHVFALIPRQELYARTGIQLMSINTVFQLAAMAAADDPSLAAASSLLMMADLFHYWLSGVQACELTNATTSQVYDPVSGDWASDLLERLGVRPTIFPEIVPPGTVLGPLLPQVADETRIGGAVVVATATHDTAAAVAAIPFRDPRSAYISSGTWSLIGVEVDSPVIDERSFVANLTNEGGVARTLLLRNATGLWLLDECRRAWARAGADVDYENLVLRTGQSPPLLSLIDTEDPAFLMPGDMPGRIRDHCARAGEPPPVDQAAVARCVLESLALKYRQTIDVLEAVTGSRPPAIHVVGGGALNRLLCQWTADATGLPVIAGPVEAAEIGNLAMQALALGELASITEVRELVDRSFTTQTYEPGARAPWDDAYARLERATAARRR